MLMLADLDYENFIQIAQADIAETLGMQKTNVSRAVRALLDVGVIFEGPKVGRSKTYRLNEQFGWKGTVTNHKKTLKTALVSFRAAGFKEPVAGGQSTEHCMQFLVDCLSCIALLPPQNPLRVFAPRSPERPSRHGSGSALSATGNRLGDPRPHRCNTDGLRPPTNRVAACTVQMGFAGGWRGSWRPESPWLGYRRA